MQRLQRLTNLGVHEVEKLQTAAVSTHDVNNHPTAPNTIAVLAGLPSSLLSTHRQIDVSSTTPAASAIHQLVQSAEDVPYGSNLTAASARLSPLAMASSALLAIDNNQMHAAHADDATSHSSDTTASAFLSTLSSLFSASNPSAHSLEFLSWDHWVELSRRLNTLQHQSHVAETRTFHERRQALRQWMQQVLQVQVSFSSSVQSTFSTQLTQTSTAVEKAGEVLNQALLQQKEIHSKINNTTLTASTTNNSEANNANHEEHLRAVWLEFFLAPQALDNRVIEAKNRLKAHGVHIQE